MEIDKAKDIKQLTTQYLFYERLIQQLETATKVTGFVGNMEFVIPRDIVPQITRVFEKSKASLEKMIRDL